jgi:hypothetical protein
MGPSAGIVPGCAADWCRMTALAAVSAPPRFRLSLLLMLAYLVAISGYAEAGEWRGERTVRDGVAYVRNPAEPMEPPIIYDAVESWRLESETSDGELVFGAISDAEADDAGNVYLLDYLLKTVHIISPIGEILGSVGGEGEGPGEFQSVDDCFLTAQSGIAVLDYVSRRIVYLTKEGVQVGTWSPSGFGELRVRPRHAMPTERGLVVSCRLLEPRGQEAVLRYFLALFNGDGEATARYFERTVLVSQDAHIVFDEEAAEHIDYFTATPSGTVYVAPYHSQYLIHRYDSDGRLDMVISKEYEHLSRSEQTIARKRALLEGQYAGFHDYEVSVEEYDRDLFDIRVAPGGMLWVETSRGWLANPVGTAMTYDTFDSAGRFIHQVIIRGAIDGREDFFFLLGDRAIRVSSSLDVLVAWLAPDDNADTEGTHNESDNPQAVICYRLVRSE